MRIFCYTREPLEDIIYAARLAYSMHLAYEKDGKIIPFHHNEGLLYATGVSDPQTGVITAKSLKSPYMFEKADGTYGIVAVRTESEGEPEAASEGCVLVFETKDFVHYKEIGLYRLQEAGVVQQVKAEYCKTCGKYVFAWKNEDGKWYNGEGNPYTGEAISDVRDCDCGGACVGGVCGVPASVGEQEVGEGSNCACGESAGGEETCECGGCACGEPAGVCTCETEGAVWGNSLEISDEMGDYLLKKLLVPVCEKIVPYKDGAEVTGEVSADELADVKAAAFYSDGSMVLRKIDWSPVTEGATEACGYVHQEYFDFPFTENRADPCCMYRDGKYYFIATNDADGNHTLYMRCSDTLQGVADAEETLYLDSETYEGIGGLLWAPEFHEIDGQLYIFHAATPGEFFWEESHVMKLREGGDPMCREDWSRPHMVVKKDGTPLCEAGKVISLDMTTFEYEGDIYAMWSQRQFLPVDQGAWLYLAKIDRKEPWKLLNDPVCIVKPEYGWENNHTFVVEGPYALEKDGQLMITYSGAAVDATYVVGLLKPVMGSDIMDPENWVRSNYPYMSSRSAEDEYGTGHNSYVEDENGLVWNFYHGRRGVTGPRSSGARRVHFDIDGEPMLDVIDAVDLPKEMRDIKVKLQ